MVNNVLVKDTDIGSFKDFRDMNQWEKDVYAAVDQVYPENKYRNFTQMFGEEFSKKWLQHRAKLIKKEQDRENSKIIYNDIEYSAIYHFDVLHCGWEMDNRAWIIEDEGTRKLIMTNHGIPYESEVAELKGFISGYKKVLENSEKALELLQADC